MPSTAKRGRLALPSALAAGLVILVAPAAANDLTPAPDGASARIVQPADGATVSSPVTVVFGLTGMGVAPVGVDLPNTGHHHLLINQDLPPLDQPIPATMQMLHFGGGQTETVLELEPGEYRLQLLVGDHRHIPHDPPIFSEPITIVVD